MASVQDACCNFDRFDSGSVWRREKMSCRMYMLYGGAQNGSNMLQDEVFPIHGQFPGKYKYTVSGNFFSIFVSHYGDLNLTSLFLRLGELAFFPC